eukprot:TRINITY_DN6901_c0_g1_i1.p1 TRINITY_DN6901_c0_g1~~TRINITY_DN6901_c0_g1_i1.p1  ORF type:complete len:468 (-),score=70.21 TRINITY_DN6901_c0_g1_i1:176-1579(-)
MAGWLVGWNITLEYGVASAAIAQGWAGYLINLIETVSPSTWVPPQLFNYPFVWGMTVSPLAFAMVTLCAIICFLGVKGSSLVNVIMSVLNISLVISIIIIGSVYWDSRNWYNFIGEGVSWSGFPGMLKGASIVFFSFVGFDCVTTLAGEVANPSDVFPKAIGGSLALITALYVGVSVVLCGLVTATTVNIEAPLSAAFLDAGLGWASILVAVGSVTTLSSSTLAGLMGQPRIFFQMAVDGLLFKPFSWVNSNGVITFGTTFTFMISGTLALLFNIDSLSQMISGGTLIAYSTVCGGIIAMRYSDEPQDMIFEASYFKTLNPLAYQLRRRISFILFVHVLCSIIVGLTINYQWHYSIGLSFGILIIIIICIVSIIRPTDSPATFQVPLTPLVPLLGVTINLILITSLTLGALLRVLIWSVIGLLIYLLYGVQNSKLNEEATPIFFAQHEQSSIGGITSDERPVVLSSD